MEPSPISTLNTTAQKMRGFTLVEMLVVLGIMAVLSLVVLTGQSSFNKSLVLNDTAYSVAFSARQAQTFGISSRKYGAVNNTGYGLYFDKANLDRYVMYADTDNTLGVRTWCPVSAGNPDVKPGDCLYKPATDQLIKNTIFTKGYTIQKFCTSPVSGGGKKCTDASTLDSMDIVFLRPNTTTIITGKNGAAFHQAKCAEIYIKAPTTPNVRTIRISQLGEISMNQICP